MKKIEDEIGLNNAALLMKNLHNLGNNILENLLKYYSAPNERKTLRYWTIKETAKLVGRTEQHIRSIESKKNNSFVEPVIGKNNRRMYSLENINALRDYFGTKYIRPQPSPSIILAITNFKGGVAKSTTSLNFAHKCAIEGLKVLCVDLDPQATLTLGFGFVPDIHLKADDTIVDALSKTPKAIHRLIKKTYFDGISIIPGNLGLTDIELNLINIEEQDKQTISLLGEPQERLKNALDLIKDNYDIIILDCGPNLGILTINAVTAANALIIPIPPMMPDLGSFITLAGTFSVLFEEINKSFDFFRILLTKNPRSKESSAIETLMRETFGRHMTLNTVLSSVEFEKASAQFGSVYELPRANTESYRRAIESLDDAFGEILSAFKDFWAESAATKTNRKSSAKKSFAKTKTKIKEAS